MRNTVLVPPGGDPIIGKQFQSFMESALVDKVALDELATTIWSFKEQQGRGFFVRTFNSVPSGNYFDEAKRIGRIKGIYVNSGLLPHHNQRFKAEFEQLMSAYNPQREFMIAGIATINHKLYFSHLAIAYPDSLLLKWASSKTFLSRAQIKKRLRRLVQARQRLLVLDALEPEVKDNLEVWLEEANKLPITVVISSSTGEAVSQLPQTLQSQMLTLECK